MRIQATILAAALLLIPCLCGAQEGNLTPEQREKQMYESIQKQVETFAEQLNLEGWQVFYVDSILTYNYSQVDAQFEQLSKNRVSNYELYYDIRDEWEEKTYNAMRKVLNDAQWQKYLKYGASREKKARDKRAAKKQKTK